jgi:hypothetical protein
VFCLQITWLVSASATPTVQVLELQQRMLCYMLISGTTEIASFVIEAGNDWREDSGSMLVKYSMHAPSHACVAAGKGSTAATAPVFLAPSATTGTLFATGRMGVLAAAVAPWTLEAAQDQSLSSSVQFISCIARQIASASDSRSNDISGATGSWACDDAHDQVYELKDATHDFSASCASSSPDDAGRVMCHLTIHFMVTASALPPWAAGPILLLYLYEPHIFICKMNRRQVLMLPPSTFGWTMVAASLLRMQVCSIVQLHGLTV